MTQYLLDTNIALLGLSNPERIHATVKRAIENGTTHLSVLSYWEIALKTMKGKLTIADPRSWWGEALEYLAAIPLPLRPEHISTVLTLPAIHQDPFDRALVAQAVVEQMVLVTADGEIPKYKSCGLRVLTT